MSDIVKDELGRWFCRKHRREVCHSCCLDCDLVNRQVEIEAGIRKPPSEIETLTEQKSILLRGISFLEDNRAPATDANYRFHLGELKKIETRLGELQTPDNARKMSEAQKAVQLKNDTHDAEMAAMVNAWAKQNPGKSTMEFGGPETQALYDEVVAPFKPNPRVCSYCSKGSEGNLLVCGQCKSTAYCGRDCQKQAWKGHKKFCTPPKDESKPHWVFRMK